MTTDKSPNLSVPPSVSPLTMGIRIAPLRLGDCKDYMKMMPVKYLQEFLASAKPSVNNSLLSQHGTSG